MADHSGPGATRARTLAVGLFAASLCYAGPTLAADLKNFVTTLYGGDGIQLNSTAGHNAHFTADSLTAFSDLGTGIGSGVGAFSLTSSATAVTFDLSEGVPKRANDSLGPLLAERATTLGGQKINFGVGYNHIDFTRFRGQDLSNVQLTFRHLADGSGAAYLNDVLTVNVKIKLREDVFSTFATYGLTDRWDVGVVVPIVRIEARASAVAKVTEGTPGGAGIHNFGGDAESPFSTTGGNRTGMGDVVLRSKFLVLKDTSDRPLDVALAGQVKLASGDQNNLLGDGKTAVRGVVVVSKKLDAISPHLNLGYEYSTGGDTLSNVRYSTGFDLRVTPTLTAAFDVVGRTYMAGADKNIVDFGVGAKWEILPGMPFSANILVPVNRQTGLRPDYVYFFGLEYTF